MKVDKVLLFKSEFYTLNYKEMNFFFLNDSSKLVYILKIFIYVKIY